VSFEDNLFKILEKSFKEGEEEAKKGKKPPLSWITFYGFEKDPFFLQPIDANTLDLFVNRFETLTQLAKLIGFASKLNVVYHIALIGPNGIGKSSIVNVLHEIARKRYDGALYIVQLDQENGKDLTKRDIPGPSRDDYTYIIFDETEPPEKTIDLINNQFYSNRKLIISTWTPEHFQETLTVHDKIILEPFEKNDLLELLEKRVKWGGGELIITSSALNKLLDYSFGVPYLLLKLIREAYEIAYRNKKDEIDTEIIDYVANQHGDILKDPLELTTLEKKICYTILQNSFNIVTINDIITKMDIERPLAWKYLERLKNKGILKKSYEGKKVEYKLTEFAKIKLQLKLAEKGGL